MSLGPRPGFELSTRLSAEAVVVRVGQRLRAKPCPICGLSMPERIELHVPSERQHLWSPELVVQVQAAGAGSRLVGRFGPHPHVWTLFMALLGVSAIGTLVALGYAYAQWTMGQTPTALWAIFVAVATLAMLHLVSQLGRGLGAEQMQELRGFLEATLSDTRRN